MTKMSCLCLAVLTLGALCVCGASPKPVYSWDFESGGKIEKLSGGERRPGQGAEGSVGAWVGKGAVCQAPFFPLDFKAFTVDMKFRLDGDVDEIDGNTLFCYVTKPWGKASFRLRLTRDRRLEAVFQKAKGANADAGFEWVASSEPIAVAKEKFHFVRFAVTDEGHANAWVDGVLALDKSGAPGLAELAVVNPPKLVG